MGRPVIADQKLFTLRSNSQDGPALVRKLVTLQDTLFESTGHLLAYSDEYVLRRLKEGVEAGQMPVLWVRCMRCGCTAMLDSWIRSANYGPIQRRIAVSKAIERDAQGTVAFLMSCRGAELALDFLTRKGALE